ncbi:aprataxin and PNK-like factor [Thalassophryne amazonica]|uniref:aprataxin and PNK-like factor n=1 Tax=Thalassophryne amazonica TaxID=390379 RepID=UPI001471E538|nr:aprataxin and PNK-like factor [Thalassophryne amazonica]
MSNFVLVPVDGGDPVQVPSGETVLGRGALLGVSDKRVSRHHGLLENLNGQLHLKPTHVNPCFMQSSLNDAPHSLDKDRWFPLHHGDLFSLLPGQYLYRVEAAGAEDVTPRNSQMFGVEEPQKHAEAPPPVGQDQGQTPPPDLPKESTVEEEAQSPNRTGDQVCLLTAELSQRENQRRL